MDRRQNGSHRGIDGQLASGGIIVDLRLLIAGGATLLDGGVWSGQIDVCCQRLDDI